MAHAFGTDTALKAWFAAAVLPLPALPAMGEKGKDEARPATATSIAQDLENRLAPMDEAHYENARWWRNLNRLMMIAGVFIIAAIVSQPCTNGIAGKRGLMAT